MVGDRNYRVLVNPDYNDICKELTYNSGSLVDLYKVNIICEDKMAEKFIKTIIKKDNIKKNNYISN